MKRTISAGTLAVILSVLVLTAAFAFLWKPALSANVADALPGAELQSNPRAQGDLPEFGWTVCADLGVGPVPGLGEYRQRFDLCNGAGWRIQAYCLDPGVEAPATGTICSLTGGVIWCGENVQKLKEYLIIETPLPTATETVTLTATSTNTPTATPSQTPSATPTAMATKTLIPAASMTPAGTSTAELVITGTPDLTWTSAPTRPPVGITLTATRSGEQVITMTPTAYVRPHPGGPGNSGFVLGLGLTLAALLGGSLPLLLRKRA